MGLLIKDMINVAENILRDSGDQDYKTDAKILLCDALKYDEKKLFMSWAHETADYQSEAFFELIERRSKGEPTQYIIGKTWFMGVEISVDPRVLIPRSDTEVLVEQILSWLDKNNKARRALDLCTGSGAIALAIAKRKPGLKITASDISDDAIAVASENAKRHRVRNVGFIQSDMFEALRKGALGQKFDFIVSNPPYIKSDELPKLQREICEHEPMIALDGGADGLDFYRQIIDSAPDYLKRNGALFLEIGANQAGEVCELIKDKGGYTAPEVKQDIAGLDRMVFTTSQ